MDAYQKFIFTRTYARYRDDLGRRETWKEVVDRYMDFMLENLGDKLKKEEYEEVKEAIINQDVVPSMRLVWGAGDAVRKNNAIAYNCSFLTPTKWQDFGEILFLLTCGCGVGFSVESKFVEQLPNIEPQKGKTFKLQVPDNREGWADSLVFGLSKWANGEDVDFDYSLIRPKGARLKTMGGRASGYEPLKNLLEFTKEKVLSRQGHKLRPIDVHDIICKIGDIVIAGGVRRSSEISLSDLTDEEMRDAKKGAFYHNEPQRTMANNSVVYEEKPTLSLFMKEWLALMESGSGERGIFNRGGLRTQLPKRRLDAMAGHLEATGTNPCGEIVLRNKEFCNLSEVVARKGDNQVTLLEKIRIATILGTYQSTLTKFPYLSKDWKKNCDEERLLGVSITGQFDCKKVRNPATLETMKEYAVKINKQYAKRFGINPSVSVTCVKPSGTVSQLVNASSGMHPRFSPYYIRRVRISATDPLFKMLKDQGVPHKPEVGQVEPTVNTYVLEFPVKSPDGAITADEINATDQLEHWKMVKENFTEHNPSQTVYVGDDEWFDIGAWVWRNWDIVGGLSFLPKTSHVYELAPYTAITETQYDKLVKEMPEIDFSALEAYEKEDNTIGASEPACQGGTCEII